MSEAVETGEKGGHSTSLRERQAEWEGARGRTLGPAGPAWAHGTRPCLRNRGGRRRAVREARQGKANQPTDSDNTQSSIPLREYVNCNSNTKVFKYSPNIHTSLAEVKRRKLIDSGAIHLIGNFPLEARRLILESKTSLSPAQESNRASWDF